MNTAQQSKQRSPWVLSNLNQRSSVSQQALKSFCQHLSATLDDDHEGDGEDEEDYSHVTIAADCASRGPKHLAVYPLSWHLTV